MKFTPQALFTSAVLLSLSTTVYASNATARREIQADYDKISAAEKSLDYNTFAQAVTDASEPSSVWVAPNGKAFSLTEYLALRKKAMKEIKSITTDIYTVVEVKSAGDTAIERTHALITGTETDPNAAYGLSGVLHTVSVDRLYETSWVKYSAGWKMHSVRVISSTLTVDGKIVTPPVLRTPSRTTRRRSSRYN